MIYFIIPAYNSQRTISKCIESVLRQNIDKEIIVVDNGSTDSTGEIIKHYPVIYIYEPKKGPAAARNRGLNEVKNKKLNEIEYVAFVDSDVILPDGWAEQALKILKENPIIAGVGGWTKSIERNLISETLEYLLYGNIKRESKYVKSLPTLAVLYRYRYIEDIYFNELFPNAAAEDIDFNLKLIKKGYKLLFSENLYVYHDHPVGLFALIKKWFNYGRYYPLPYFLNKQLKDLSLWGRMLYLPLVLVCLIFGLCTGNFIPLISFISILPILYLILGIRAKIKNFFKLIVFIFVHSLKQLAQVSGIWIGIIVRTIK